jgi:hypothetical protein
MTNAVSVELVVAGRRQGPRFVAAGLLATAGLVHAALISEHFDEGRLVGWAFVTMAMLQVVIAALLIVRPGPGSEHVARTSLVVLVALYLLARVVPVPGDTEPEDATILGALTVAIEVAALVALARLPRARPPRLRPATIGWLAGAGSALALLLVTSSLRYITADLSVEYQGSAPALLWRDDGLSVDSPRLTLYLTNHLVLFGSLLTLTLIAALAFEVGLGAAASRAAVLAGCPLRRHWFWTPAVLAAPVCCGAPLFGIVGPAVFAALLKWGWVPLAVAVLAGSFALRVPGHSASPNPPRNNTSG